MRRFRLLGSLLLGLLALVSGLVGAFVLVTRSGPDGEESAVVAGPALQEARALRRQANRVASLLEAYLTRIPLEATGATPADQAWVTRNFTAMLREVRVEHQAVLPRGASAAGDHLGQVIERIAVMARNPSDRVLRQGTVADARRAVEAAEARIVELGARHHLGEAARILEF